MKAVTENTQDPYDEGKQLDAKYVKQLEKDFEKMMESLVPGA